MQESNDYQLVRCPAGYLVALNDAEDDNMAQMQQLKNRTQSKKDMVAGLIYLLLFALALFVGLI